MATKYILLVDENLEDLLTLEATLVHLDAVLVKASSGKEALRTLLTHDFAVLVIDMQLSDISGIDLASLIRLRPRSANVPIVFTSPLSNEEIRHKYRLAQSNLEFVRKPIDAQILVKKVEFFLEAQQ